MEYIIYDIYSAAMLRYLVMLRSDRWICVSMLLYEYESDLFSSHPIFCYNIFFLISSYIMS